MLLHPLTNAEIQKYYQNEPRFNGVYSRNNLHKIKDGTHVKTLHEYKSIKIHWISFYMNGDNVTYIDSIRVGYISKGLEKFIGNKNIKVNIHRTQGNDSITCGYFCIGFIDLCYKMKVC